MGAMEARREIPSKKVGDEGKERGQKMERRPGEGRLFSLLSV